MQLAVHLVAPGSLPGVRVPSPSSVLLSSGGQSQDAVVAAYLIALVLAVTAGIVSDIAALRQQRLVRSVVLALLTLLVLVIAAITLPATVLAQFLGLPGLDITAEFAPVVVLLLVALGSLLLARSRPGTHQGRSDGKDAATATPSTPAALRPPRRPALISMVAGFYTPIAIPLAFLLAQLTLGPTVCDPNTSTCPPPKPPLSGLLTVVADGLFVLIIPAVGVALVSAHVALSRLRHQAAPTPWRSVAWLGFVLGYATFPVLMALFVWAVLTGVIGGE